MSLLIGLVGRSRSGKDTVGQMLKDTDPNGWALMSFAAPIKKICGGIFRFTDEQLYGDLKDTPDPRYRKADGTFLLPREPLKAIGQAARECYPHIWAELGVHTAMSARQEGVNVAFTDVRFVNEARLIREDGGFVWRIFRPSADSAPANHISETEMNTPEMDALVTDYLQNDVTLEELKRKAQFLLSRLWKAIE